MADADVLAKLQENLTVLIDHVLHRDIQAIVLTIRYDGVSNNIHAYLKDNGSVFVFDLFQNRDPEQVLTAGEIENLSALTPYVVRGRNTTTNYRWQIPVASLSMAVLTRLLQPVLRKFATARTHDSYSFEGELIKNDEGDYTKIRITPFAGVRVQFRTPSYVATSDSDETCPICFEPFLEGQHIQPPACGHRFHEGCIQRYYVQKATSGRKLECPMCRGSALGGRRRK